MTTANPVQLWPCKWGWCRETYTVKDDLVRHVLAAHVATAKKVKLKDIPLLIRAEQGASGTGKVDSPSYVSFKGLTTATKPPRLHAVPASFIPSIPSNSATQETAQPESNPSPQSPILQYPDDLSQPNVDSTPIRSSPAHISHTTSSAPQSPFPRPASCDQPEALASPPLSHATSLPSSSRRSSSSAEDVEHQLTQSVDPESPPKRPQESSPQQLQSESALERPLVHIPRFDAGLVHVPRPSSPAVAGSNSSGDGVEDEDVHMDDMNEENGSLDVSQVNGHAEEDRTIISQQQQQQQQQQQSLPHPNSNLSSFHESPNDSNPQQEERGPPELGNLITPPLNHEEQEGALTAGDDQQTASVGSQSQTNGFEYRGEGYSEPLQLLTQAPFSSQSSTDGSQW